MYKWTLQILIISFANNILILLSLLRRICIVYVLLASYYHIYYCFYFDNKTTAYRYGGYMALFLIVTTMIFWIIAIFSIVIYNCFRKKMKFSIIGWTIGLLVLALFVYFKVYLYSCENWRDGITGKLN
jgi:hypothetical protein